MTGLILRYGILAGLIVAVPVVWRMLTLDPDSKNPLGGMLLGYLTMLIALTAVFVGVKRYRDRTLGGVIRFLPALGIGLAISAVASLVYVIGWEISMAYSPYDFIGSYSRHIVESVRAQGGSPADLAQAAAAASDFAASYSRPWIRMSWTFIEMFPVGVLVSLIAALLLRNSRFLPARPPA